jgi:hypothetical protein
MDPPSRKLGASWKVQSARPLIGIFLLANLHIQTTSAISALYQRFSLPAGRDA